MTLRELINYLEEYSENGKNDNLPVKIDDSYGYCFEVYNVYKGVTMITLNNSIKK